MAPVERSFSLLKETVNLKEEKVIREIKVNDEGGAPHGLNGESLVVFLQETVSLEFVQSATLRLLVMIKVVEGVFVHPDLLCVLSIL